MEDKIKKIYDEMIDAFEQNLGDQINKLRFIRELTYNCGTDFAGFNNESIQQILEGLGAILYDVIVSYDEVHGLIPAVHV